VGLSQSVLAAVSQDGGARKPKTEQLFSLCKICGDILASAAHDSKAVV
jgi:hypothetical protein